MALQTGTRTSFNDTVGLKVDLSDQLPLIVSPTDVPLYTRTMSKAPSLNAVSHQWLEDTIVATSEALGANVLIADATITVTDFTLYKKGYVIKIESELLRVSATPTTTTVTVSRGYAGTTAAAHNTPLTVLFVGQAVTDGADPEPFSTTNRSVNNNLMQFFVEKISISTVDQWQQTYGVADKFGYEVEKRLKNLAILAERSMLHGVRSTDNTNSTRTMGGIFDKNLILAIGSSTPTVNSLNIAATLTETLLNDAFQRSFDNGGNVDSVFVSGALKRKLTAFVGGSAGRPVIIQGAGDKMRAGGSVDYYTSDFGEVEIVLDRWIPSDTVACLQTKTISRVNGIPFTLENLAQTGPARNAEIYGLMSLEVKGGLNGHHQIISGAS